MNILIILLISIISFINADPDVASISRDRYGRADPNAILNGFFPVWAILMLCLSGIFLIIAIIGFICFKLGCANPKKFKKLPQ